MPPTPTSINREEPGGDADDPHLSALERLVNEPWGWRNDKQDALHVPVPDWKNWRRIRYYGVPSFVGFRYGDDHHAVIGVWVRDADENVTSEQCLDSFEKWGAPTAHTFSVKLGPVTTARKSWNFGGTDGAGELEIVIKSLDAEVNTLFATKEYAAAYAGYTMWPKTCTVFGIAVPFKERPELARQLRDRYVADGFHRLRRNTANTPTY